MRASVPLSALVGVLVGFGGTVAVVVQAARAVGATGEETASAVGALCLAIAGTSAWLSWRHRMPIVTAWSTPGAALVAAGGAVGVPAAAGAFALAGALVVLAALARPLARLVERLPAPLAAAMLAGVLARFVTAGFAAAGAAPALVLPVVGVFLVVRLAHPALAVVAALAAGLALAFATGAVVGPLPAPAPSLPAPQVPAFEPLVLLGLGLPLFVVTMASQNLPGLAALRAAGFEPPTRSALLATGAASLLTAPFGALSTNLSAIVASILNGPDVHPDPARRWPAGVIYGALYLALALFGASLVGLVAALPGALVAAVAGLALLGPLTASLTAALSSPRERPAAVLAFAVTASGLELGGLGSALWGLASGLLALGLEEARERWAARRAGAAG